MIDTEVRNMMKFVDKILGSPYFLRELLFAGKYASVLQFFVAFLFCGLARFGGPLGSLEYAEIFRECALVTLTLTLVVELLVLFLRRLGTKF